MSLAKDASAEGSETWLENGLAHALITYLDSLALPNDIFTPDTPCNSSELDRYNVTSQYLAASHHGVWAWATSRDYDACTEAEKS